MVKQTFGTSKAPLSPAVRAGDYIYVAGQVPVDEAGLIVGRDIAEQTRQVFENLEAALALAGASLADIVKTNVWLSDHRDFAAFNAIYSTYFPSEPPARSTVEARLMLNVSVEIEAIAYSPLAQEPD